MGIPLWDPFPWAPPLGDPRGAIPWGLRLSHWGPPRVPLRYPPRYPWESSRGTPPGGLAPYQSHKTKGRLLFSPPPPPVLQMDPHGHSIQKGIPQGNPGGILLEDLQGSSLWIIPPSSFPVMPTMSP